MTDLEIQGEYYAYQYLEQLAKGEEPIIEDGPGFIEEALEQWEQEDSATLEELEEVYRLKEDENDWEEVII